MYYPESQELFFFSGKREVERNHNLLFLILEIRAYFVKIKVGRMNGSLNMDVHDIGWPAA